MPSVDFYRRISTYVKKTIKTQNDYSGLRLSSFLLAQGEKLAAVFGESKERQGKRLAAYTKLEHKLRYEERVRAYRELFPDDSKSALYERVGGNRSTFWRIVGPKRN
jgi:hypothetical protein